MGKRLVETLEEGSGFAASGSERPAVGRDVDRFTQARPRFQTLDPGPIPPSSACAAEPTDPLIKCPTKCPSRDTQRVQERNIYGLWLQEP